MEKEEVRKKERERERERERGKARGGGNPNPLNARRKSMNRGLLNSSGNNHERSETVLIWYHR